MNIKKYSDTRISCLKCKTRKHTPKCIWPIRLLPKIPGRTRKSGNTLRSWHVFSFKFANGFWRI